MNNFQSFTLKRAGIFVAAASLLAVQTLPVRTNAAAGKFILSTNSTIVQEGGNVEVSIELDPGTKVDGAEVDLTFDDSKLELVTINGNDSAFPIQLLENKASGKLSLARGILGSTLERRGLVAKVSFKAKSNSGKTTIKAEGNATYSGNYINPSGTSIYVSFGSGTSTGGDSGGSGNRAKDPNLTLGDVKAEFNKANLQIQSKKPAKTFVLYGSEENKLYVATKSINVKTSGEIKIDENELTPGVKYYYKVVAEYPDGKRGESEVKSFQTKGYTVELQLKDKNGNALSKKAVTLHSEPKNATTDSSGLAVFNDVSPGEHRVEYEAGGQTYSEKVKVENALIKTNEDGTQTADKQFYEVTFNNLSAIQRIRIVPVVITLSLVVLAIAAVYIIRFHRHKLIVVANSIKSRSAPNEVYDQTRQSQPPQPPQSQQDKNQRISENDNPDPGSLVDPNKKDKNDKT